MTIAFCSSGELLADRRASYAEMLLEAGDKAAAADLMRQAVQRVPDWVAGLFRFGEIAHAAGEIEAASQAWRDVLRLDPQDRFGATLKLAAIGLVPTPNAPPPAYVESLFDAYAPKFETALVERLDYRVPVLIANAISIARPSGAFRHVVDLGCGTGLMGEYLRGRASLLRGVDISEAMLRKAAEKRIYDRLERDDINRLQPSLVPADLVVAADVFVYLGDLDATFERVAAMLEAGGLFGFSVESHAGSDDFVLRNSLRFAHSLGYVRRLLEARGLAIASLTEAELRADRNVPVEGLIVLAERCGRTVSHGLLETACFAAQAIRPRAAG